MSKIVEPTYRQPRVAEQFTKRPGDVVDVDRAAVLLSKNQPFPSFVSCRRFELFLELPPPMLP